MIVCNRLFSADELGEVKGSLSILVIWFPSIVINSEWFIYAVSFVSAKTVVEVHKARDTASNPVTICFYTNDTSSGYIFCHPPLTKKFNKQNKSLPSGKLWKKNILFTLNKGQLFSTSFFYSKYITTWLSLQSLFSDVHFGPLIQSNQNEGSSRIPRS